MEKSQFLVVFVYAEDYQEYAKIGPDFFRHPERVQKTKKLQIFGQFWPILAYFGAQTQKIFL